MPTLAPLDLQEAIDLLCATSARQILEGLPFADYRDRMAGMVDLLLTAGGIPKAEQSAEMVRGVDEAYRYRTNYLDLWRSSGALCWGAGIKLTKPAPVGDDQHSLPGLDA